MFRRLREALAETTMPATVRKGAEAGVSDAAMADAAAAGDSTRDEAYMDCAECGGTGMKEADTCPECGGSGRVMKMQEDDGGDPGDEDDADGVADTGLSESDAGAGDDDEAAIRERDFSDKARAGAAKAGAAMPDGSFPIETTGDLKNAVQAIGRAKDPAAAKAHIIKRAKALGATAELPDGWTKSSTREVAAHLARQPQPVAVRNEHRMREAVKIRDGVYEVIVIEEGLGNREDRNYYTKKALREAVRTGMFEGLRSYADHPSKSEETDRPERSIKQLVGNYRNARYRETDGRGQVYAEFHVIDGNEWQWVRDLVESAIEDRTAGLTPKIGISIDGGGVVEVGDVGGEPTYLVQNFTYLPSADIVTTPGAGGTFVRRLSESLRGLGAQRPGVIHNKEDLMDPKQVARRLRESLTVLREKADDEAALTGALDTFAAVADELEHSNESDTERKLREAEEARDAFKTERDEARRERDEAKATITTTDKELLAGKVLREAQVPDDLSSLWQPSVAACADEEAMKSYVAGKQAEQTAIERRVRESLVGVGRVEGAGAMALGGSTPSEGEGRDTLATAGIPVKAAAAASDSGDE